ATGTQEIAAVRNLVRASPIAALALVAGGFAIAGAPPFALFFSELLIFKGGLASGQYVTIALLAAFVVIAFCAVMYHLNRMAFGAGAMPAARAIPLPCTATIALAALPLVAIGIYVPHQLSALLAAAAKAIGG
ncbi:MAG TPA: proton-conducting transporter membrane subunit, partial [Stellaceae bacterium]|nr:proton-conducting transporter membrane subunit [Stellaceae bacterium]